MLSILLQKSPVEEKPKPKKVDKPKVYKAPDFESIRVSFEFKGETYYNDFPTYETLSVSILCFLSI